MAVHTTCLSETIGDDLPSFIMQSEVPEGKVVIHANTPSYVGSHVTGFSNMCKAMVSYLAVSNGEPKKARANVLPGSSTRDMRGDQTPAQLSSAWTSYSFPTLRRRRFPHEQVRDVRRWRYDRGNRRCGQLEAHAGPRRPGRGSGRGAAAGKCGVRCVHCGCPVA
jgi:hypothetical protein